MLQQEFSMTKPKNTSRQTLTGAFVTKVEAAAKAGSVLSEGSSRNSGTKNDSKEALLPTATRIRKIGNSQGVVLNKETLAMLGATEGDVINFARTANGITVSVSNEETDRLRASAKRIMEKRRQVLRALAQ
jgi:putative addiction module antidote